MKMAKGGGAAVAAFIGSLVLSLAGAGVAGYFLLPRLFPGMEGDPYIPEEPYIPAFAYEEFDSTAQCMDDQITWAVVPDTQLNITIRNNSRIYMTFSGSYLIGVSDTLGTQSARFEVFLGLTVGYGGKYAYIKYLDLGGVNDAREIAGAISMDFATIPLPNGTYYVQVWYRSLASVPGSNYLLFRTPAMDYSRSLMAQEILT
jgi:hypothetical protein